MFNQMTARITEVETQAKLKVEEVMKTMEASEARLDRMAGNKSIDGATVAIKLKPMDTKDVKKPEEFDFDPKGESKDFVTWHKRFKDLLVSRNWLWKNLLEAIESFKSDKIMGNEVIIDRIRKRMELKGGIEDEEVKEYENNMDEFMRQLLSYLTSYTKGTLLAKTQKTPEREVFNVYRDVIYRGKNRNKNRLVTMKAKVLDPQRAKNIEELDNILTGWLADVETIEEDMLDENGIKQGDWTMSDDTKKTILLKIMPIDFVKDMRDEYNEDKGLKYDDFSKS